ncbi:MULTISPECIES: hypothetical protein [unclassified Rathayibacter]|uniref:hypothetical protein n=1 Tax=unclassified Rathayibacter TaxID=2609250 RepID=UPI000CE8FDEC|nr:MULTISPECIES: hypothetical protein [unclassified Rathayibacter]PPH74558.1 hypothetical protein C5C90_10730 [Rathayibacter sp. AY1D4]PPH85534.1 hypothetical protein C5C64_16205 [Rathayibacter sp. AY1D3]
MTDTNAIGRLSAVAAATGLVLALAGCTAPLDGTAVASPSATSAAPSLPTSTPTDGSDATDSPAAQSLLEQLPIRTSLESVSDDATGDLLIEEREDGTVWLSLSGLSLTGAVEPRVLFTSAPLEDNDGELRFPSDVGSEVGSLTADADQELQITDPETIGSIESILILGVGDPGVRNLAAARVSPSSTGQ